MSSKSCTNLGVNEKYLHIYFRCDRSKPSEPRQKGVFVSCKQCVMSFIIQAVFRSDYLVFRYSNESGMFYIFHTHNLTHDLHTRTCLHTYLHMYSRIIWTYTHVHAYYSFVGSAGNKFRSLRICYTIVRFKQ